MTTSQTTSPKCIRGERAADFCSADGLSGYGEWVGSVSSTLRALSEQVYARRRLGSRDGILHGLNLARWVGEELRMDAAEIPPVVLRIHAALYSCVIIVDDILDGFCIGMPISKIVNFHLDYCAEQLPAGGANWRRAAASNAKKWLSFERSLRQSTMTTIPSDELSSKCALLTSTLDAFVIVTGDWIKVEPVYASFAALASANAMADDMDDLAEDLAAKHQSSFMLRLVMQRLSSVGFPTLDAVCEVLADQNFLSDYLKTLRRHLTTASCHSLGLSDLGFGPFISTLEVGTRLIETKMLQESCVAKILLSSKHYCGT